MVGCRSGRLRNRGLESVGLEEFGGLVGGGGGRLWEWGIVGVGGLGVAG